MGLVLQLLSLVTVFFTVTGSLVYENQNDVSNYYRRRYHIPKAILRMGSVITPATQSIVDQDDQETFERDKKNEEYTSSSAEKAAWQDPPDFHWDKAKKLSLDDLNDAKKAAGKVKILKKAKAREAMLSRERSFELPRSDEASGLSMFQIDPVLNILRSGPYRRQQDDSYSSSDRSSEEIANWKREWKQNWQIKKYEAMNASRPKGDFVNMVAARPWGTRCGDPKQHDMPWGSCVLGMECEAEFRIYRGDIFCGRTEFVCCALQLTNYDNYQAIDPSFEYQSMSTDSNEERKDSRSSKLKEKRRREKAKRKRHIERERRKKKIKRTINKTIQEIKKLLHIAYANGTRERKRKTKMLKKFVKDLKKQYKQNRQSIKEIHQEQLLKIDTALLHKLNEIRALNENFMHNETFRDIIINGKITETGARMLVAAYPDLTSYFKFRRSIWNDDGRSRDYLDDDIEYGFYG